MQSASTASKTLSQESLSSTNDSIETRVLGSIDQILEQLGDEDVQSTFEFHSSVLVEALREARKVIVQQDHRLLEVTAKSEVMAQAQAEAIVHSVEIIEELEQTKLELSSAREAAETVAKDNQHLANTIFESSHDAVLVVCGRECIACNENALAMLREDRSSLIGNWPKAFDLTKIRDKETLSERILRRVSSPSEGTTEMLEVELQLPTLDSFWVEITLSHISMKHTDHVLLVVRDISARKNFEAELRRSRDFLNNIINAIPDPMNVVTTDRHLVVANNAYCQQLGYPREKLIGCPIDQHSGLDCMPDLFREDCLNTSESTRTSLHRYTSSDGKVHVASVKQSSFVDTFCGGEYIVSVARDVTQDRKREEKLHLLASVFRNASEGVAILSAEGVILEANPALAQMANSGSSDDLIGRKLNQVLVAPVDNFDSVIQQVMINNSWAGKFSVCHDARIVRSYWISLSRSTDELSPKAKVIALVTDVTELESSQAELKKRALHDDLTGLPNRVHFRDYLESITVDPSYVASVCFLDLDNFKHVNDSMGHAAGDDLLKTVVERIKSVIPQNAFLARFGGDEFAMVIDNRTCPRDAVPGLLEDLLAAFKPPIKLRDSETIVGISMGVCQFPEDASDVDNLMQSADIAMYVAKSEGKNRIRIFSSHMQEKVNLRHRVQSRLREALKNNHLQLYYQPKVDAFTKQTIGCESLVRWRLPSGEFVSPAEFIPVAEQTGLIVSVGDYVLKQAARQAARWASQGMQPRIAINISPYQLRSVGFTDDLIQILLQAGAKAEWFELEITENAMMDDVHHAMDVTKMLSDLGFRIAIDDFGTGYSSLSYLKHFEIDTLKIDISFVRDVVHDSYSQAIIKSIISLGRGLDLTVVAEGVEEDRQAQMLTDLGCHVLQGYLYGRPVPADEYERSLRT